MPQGVGYGPQASGQQAQGLEKLMPNAAAVADQFQNQQKPFGWLMDMIQHITGQMQPPPQAVQPAPQKPQQQPAQPAQQPQQQQGPAAQKQSSADQPAGPQVMGPAIDPAAVQQLVSLFQPNALSNLGQLPQQQDPNWNWMLAMLQQGQALRAQQKGRNASAFIEMARQKGAENVPSGLSSIIGGVGAGASSSGSSTGSKG